MNASLINEDTYKDILYVVADEFDLPHLSGYTGILQFPLKQFPTHTPLLLPHTPGFKPSTGKEISVDSVYKRLWDRNHCNHRDYQNVAVNGARSGAMNNTIVRTMQRNQQQDQPALVFFELIGNDVSYHEY